jgi:hypothetical protein
MRKKSCSISAAGSSIAAFLSRDRIVFVAKARQCHENKGFLARFGLPQSVAAM